MTEFERRLRGALGDEHVTCNAPLAPLTTFRVGGPAEWLATVRTRDDVVRAIRLAREFDVPTRVIGGGSNLLIADRGVRGLVLRLHGGDAVAVSDSTVRADGGMTINGLVRWTIARGISGLEAWAGTPGTVGGAVYGNAHFRGRLISELIDSVELITPDGEIVRAVLAEMDFAYDYSRLHRTGEIVLSADFRAGRGDPAALREVARESLAFRKRTQPLEKASAGCVFQNPDPAHDTVPDGIPWSAGALVDRAGLKEAAIGGARVSPRHANFIVNDGAASAGDIARLVDLCRRQVRERFGVQLRDEIVRLGFDDEGEHGRSEG